MKDRGFPNDSDKDNSKQPSPKAAAVLSPSRLKRFEDICEMMEKGAYNVDGRQIAEKMVSDAVRRLREQAR
ncbi:MAG: flagellar biosynthesis anti-sigma factor FlgM [Syntrophorhabdaceae bacterium]|nr:flagellar biosynthesis anti-sigma factor FlgM [Syntrophorhabdaceae bacterium]